MTTHTLPISGMHCASCKLLVEQELQKAGAKKIKVSLKDSCVCFTGEKHTILAAVNSNLTSLGYIIGKSEAKTRFSSLLVPFTVALTFAALFYFVSISPLASLFNLSTLSYSTIFLIGFLASLSTCMAVVGGVSLSVAKNLDKSGIISFFVGRTIGFFFLGMGIRALGSSFMLTGTLLTIFNLTFGVMMLILGINMLGVVHLPLPSLPRFIGRQVLFKKSPVTYLGSAILGVGTFFMPCGFTQAMQIHALTQKNPVESGITMLVFVLGTLPVLLLISAGSASLIKLSQNRTLQYTLGFILIFFSIYTFWLLVI